MVTKLEFGKEVIVKPPDAQDGRKGDLLIAPAAWHRLGVGKEEPVQEPVSLEPVAVRRELGEDRGLDGAHHPDEGLQEEERLVQVLAVHRHWGVRPGREVELPVGAPRIAPPAIRRARPSVTFLPRVVSL